MKPLCQRLLLALAALAMPSTALTAPDEIQVYTDDLDEPGERGMELHSNFVRDRVRTREYAGAQPSGRMFRLTPEFSFGVAKNWDAGFYLPLKLDTATGTSFVDGFKGRIKYLVKEDSGFFYGSNLEIAWGPLRASPSRWHTELRNIVGQRSGPWLVAVNPIFGAPLSASATSARVEFDLDLKVTRDLDERFTVGLEHYAGLGPIRSLRTGSESTQSSYAVLEVKFAGWDLHLGLGHGWTESADKRVLKLIASVPFQ
ncbi:MAG: hypothetical protein HY017_33555 [Betaproteobacteria bacterium]|nr:hypothetical protein [Betaproteobacteria bacterium]